FRNVIGVHTCALPISADLEHDGAWFYNCYPVLRATFTGTHSGFSRFFSDWFVWEDLDPNLTATFDVTGHRNTSCLDLVGSDPAWLQSLQAEIAVSNIVALVSSTLHAASVLSAVFNSLWEKH